MVRSGETNETAITKLGGMMLGHHWDAVIDQISFKLEVDLATKKERTRGISRTVSLESIAVLDTIVLTKRIILLVILS